jgi:lipid-A-disaccharide synthase-like uncharacterized protein
MNMVLGELFGVAITGWKLVGYLGVFLFAGRWFVQVIATHARGRPVVPRAFWFMSVSGSLLLLVYFTWGKNDSVGVLSNLFPMLVALYNLGLDLKSERATKDSVHPPAMVRP